MGVETGAILPTGSEKKEGSYTVQKGDTLSKIAKAQNIPLRDLITAQGPGFDPNKLRIGQILKMPEKTIDTIGIGKGIQRASYINEQAIKNALEEQEREQEKMEAALREVFGDTRNADSSITGITALPTGVEQPRLLPDDNLSTIQATLDKLYSKWDIGSFSFFGNKIPENTPPQDIKKLDAMIANLVGIEKFQYSSDVDKINISSLSPERMELINSPKFKELISAYKVYANNNDYGKLAVLQNLTNKLGWTKKYS